MDTLPIAWKTQDILAKFASGSSYPMTDLHHKCVLSELVLFSQRDERGTLIAFSMLGIAKDNATRALLLSNYMHESFRLSSGGRLPVVLAWTVCAYLNDMHMGCDVPVRTLPWNPSSTLPDHTLHTTHASSPPISPTHVSLTPTMLTVRCMHQQARKLSIVQSNVRGHGLRLWVRHGQGFDIHHTPSRRDVPW